MAHTCNFSTAKFASWFCKDTQSNHAARRKKTTTHLPLFFVHLLPHKSRNPTRVLTSITMFDSFLNKPAFAESEHSSSSSSSDDPFQPKDVDNLLAKEISQMTFAERSRIQDEIHGVESMAVKETPELIQDSLNKLQDEIDSFQGVKTAYEDALLSDSTYVTSDELRLKFLRAEFFDAKKAAARFLQSMENLFRWFGPVALQRKIRYDDLTKADVALLRTGMMQVLNSRDRAGRLVMIAAFDDRYFEAPMEVRVSSRNAILGLDCVERQDGYSFIPFIPFPHSNSASTGPGSPVL